MCYTSYTIATHRIEQTRLALAASGKENDHFPAIREMVIFGLDFVPVEAVQRLVQYVYVFTVLWLAFFLRSSILNLVFS